MKPTKIVLILHYRKETKAKTTSSMSTRSSRGGLKMTAMHFAVKKSNGRMVIARCNHTEDVRNSKACRLARHICQRECIVDVRI